jgi:hypothetical protein
MSTPAKPEQFGGKLADIALSAGTVIELVGVGLGVGHEVLHRLDRKARVDDQDLHVLGQPGNRNKRPCRIHVPIARQDRLHDEGTDVAAQQRVAIGLRIRDEFRSDPSRRSAAVLDHDGLADDPRKRLADQARDDIHRPAGGKRYDQSDGLVRVRLRDGRKRRAGEDEEDANDSGPARECPSADCVEPRHVNES